MIELFIGDEPLVIKSSIDVKVGTVERFNSDDSMDMDIVSLARILYPRNILSSGSKSTVADRALAKNNGLHFSNYFDVMDFVGLISANPEALHMANSKLLDVEKQFGRIIKNRSPLKIDPRSFTSLIGKKNSRRDELVRKWQPHFSNDISQKNDSVRLELSEKYGLEPNRISKESVAVSDLDAASKAELFEILEIYNIQQEVSNLMKLGGQAEYSYSFIPCGSVSGRSSTFGENIHGMTKEQFGIFAKKENGMRLVSIDFSQIELRLAAALWGDFAMQDVFNRGEDIHKITALSVGSRDRQLAKAINFGLLYGMGVETFMVYCAKDFGIILTHDEAKYYVDTFKKTYPSLFDRKTTEFPGLTYKTRTLGREMHAQEISGGAYDMKKYTTMRNIQIQGEGQDIQKPAIIHLNERLAGTGGIAFEIYDEIGFWIKDDSHMQSELNSICDELTDHIRDFSGFSIPVQISDRF